jgi:hypothetical protein
MGASPRCIRDVLDTELKFVALIVLSDTSYASLSACLEGMPCRLASRTPSLGLERPEEREEVRSSVCYANALRDDAQRYLRLIASG